jgi:hypothetical protein
MGLFDFLFGRGKCPGCGTAGAQKSQGRTRCANPSCRYFDASLERTGGGVSRWRGDFTPTAPVAIRYRNFRGEEKTFTAESLTLRRSRNHIVAQVAPTGRSISLSRDRIQNLEQVERLLPEVAESRPSGPTARERQVLGYHKKHKSTSPLYEKIRATYPHW